MNQTETSRENTPAETRDGRWFIVRETMHDHNPPLVFLRAAVTDLQTARGLRAAYDRMPHSGRVDIIEVVLYGVIE